MTAERTCDTEDFVAQVVPQVVSLEDAGSAMQILVQQLENYLARLKLAICQDFQEIVEECCGGGPTSISFLDLTDTPDTYVGQALKVVRVNSGANALEFASIAIPDISALLSVRIVSLFKPGNGAMTLTGSGALANVGTVQTPVPNNTSLVTSYFRASILSAAGAGSSAGTRTQTLLVTRGDTATQGGFKFYCRVGTSTAGATQRAFFGVTGATTVIGNVNPSTLTNIFGIGYDAAETVLALIYNDNALGATKVPLSASFPVDATSVYDITFYCSPNGSDITWSITNVGTGATDGGVISSDLPQNSVWLAPQVWVNNGTTGVAVRCDLVTMYLEMFS